MGLKDFKVGQIINPGVEFKCHGLYNRKRKDKQKYIEFCNINQLEVIKIERSYIHFMTFSGHIIKMNKENLTELEQILHDLKANSIKYILD